MALSYTHGASDVALIGKTIGVMLDDIATDFGADEALVSVFESRRLTYAEFREEANRCARALLAIGIGRGDRVGLWATNCTAWVLIQFATAKVGAILVNLNPAYRLAELEYALNQSEASCLIIGEGFKDVRYADMIAKLSGRMPHLRRVISLTLGSGFMDWGDFLSRAVAVEEDALLERQSVLDFDDVINVQYT